MEILHKYDNKNVMVSILINLIINKYNLALKKILRFPDDIT